MRRVVGHVLVVLRTLDRCCVFQIAEKPMKKRREQAPALQVRRVVGHVLVVLRTLDRCCVFQTAEKPMKKRRQQAAALV